MLYTTLTILGWGYGFAQIYVEDKLFLKEEEHFPTNPPLLPAMNPSSLNTTPKLVKPENDWRIGDKVVVEPLNITSQGGPGKIVKVIDENKVKVKFSILNVTETIERKYVQKPKPEPAGNTTPDQGLRSPRSNRTRSSRRSTIEPDQDQKRHKQSVNDDSEKSSAAKNLINEFNKC